LSREVREPSASAPGVASALRTNPLGRIVIPVVTDIADCPERGLDVIPPALILQTPTHELGDERAPPPRSDPAIELGDEFVIEGYVQSHVLTLAHGASLDRRP
jgi:hypothetical protein